MQEKQIGQHQFCITEERGESTRDGDKGEMG